MRRRTPLSTPIGGKREEAKVVDSQPGFVVHATLPPASHESDAALVAHVSDQVERRLAAVCYVVLAFFNFFTYLVLLKTPFLRTVFFYFRSTNIRNPHKVKKVWGGACSTSTLVDLPFSRIDSIRNSFSTFQLPTVRLSVGMRSRIKLFPPKPLFHL